MDEPVDHAIDGDGQEGDGAGGKERRDVAVVDQRRVLSDHRPPVRGRRLDAQPEERQRADGQEHEAEPEPEFGHERRHDVGEDLASQDPAQAFASESRGLHEIHHGHVHPDRAGEPEHSGGVEHADDQHEVGDRRPEDREQHQRENELRNRHQHIDETPERLIDPPADHRSQQAQRATEQECQRGRHNRDADRVARTIEQAGQ